MAEGRVLYKSFSTSRKAKKLETELKKSGLAGYGLALFPLLVAHADDHGHFPADSFTVKYDIFPVFDIDEEQVDTILSAMEKVGLISTYRVSVDNPVDKSVDKFLEIVNFKNDQKYIKKGKYPGKSGKCPPGGYSKDLETFGNFRNISQISQNCENSAKLSMERKGKERKGTGTEISQNLPKFSKNCSAAAAPSCSFEAVGNVIAKVSPNPNLKSVSNLSPEQNKALSALTSFKVDGKTYGLPLKSALRIVEQYPAELIIQQVEWLPFRKADDPVSFLSAAIFQGYEQPRNLERQECERQERQAKSEESRKASEAVLRKLACDCLRDNPECTGGGEKYCAYCPAKRHQQKRDPPPD